MMGGYVFMKYDVNWLKDEIKKGADFNFVGFWGNKADAEWERSFSNFYESKFTATVYDGREVEFDCSEQYFMYRKALEFEDFEAVDVILKGGLQPYDYKKIGRQVINFSEEVWNAKRYEAMVDGLKLKFSQNEKLKSNLLGTNDSILVETSPFDAIWGVRLGKHDRFGHRTNDWLYPERWKGFNLLGFALMEVRDWLNEK